MFLTFDSLFLVKWTIKNGSKNSDSDVTHMLMLYANHSVANNSLVKWSIKNGSKNSDPDVTHMLMLYVNNFVANDSSSLFILELK